MRGNNPLVVMATGMLFLLVVFASVVALS